MDITEFSGGFGPAGGVAQPCHWPPVIWNCPWVYAANCYMRVRVRVFLFGASASSFCLNSVFFTFYKPIFSHHHCHHRPF